MFCVYVYVDDVHFLAANNHKRLKVANIVIDFLLFTFKCFRLTYMKVQGVQLLPPEIVVTKLPSTIVMTIFFFCSSIWNSKHRLNWLPKLPPLWILKTYPPPWQAPTSPCMQIDHMTTDYLQISIRLIVSRYRAPFSIHIHFVFVSLTSRIHAN